MPTYRLTIEYDGTTFAGWQVQERGRTVQGVLLDTLSAVTGERDLDLQGSGRTDAGVHALAQVASLRCRRRFDIAHVLGELERRLPADLAVLALAEAPAGFHARHDADGRVYRYQIACRRSAFGKRTTWWVGDPLDVAAMRRGAEAFVGRHDFRSLAKRGGEKPSTVVVVEQCLVAEAPGMLLIRLAASHFLWQQVRRMVGALVAIGRGEASPLDVERWLRRELAPPTLAAPAAGLFLEAIRYPGEPLALPDLVPVGVPSRIMGAVP